MKTVPCIRIDHLSEAQKKAFIIADNNLKSDKKSIDNIIENSPELLLQIRKIKTNTDAKK